jgi:hypothetical protein
MVAKLTGKAQPSGKVANKPAGQPASPPVKKIESAASRAKANGGSANAGSGIGNS